MGIGTVAATEGTARFVWRLSIPRTQDKARVSFFGIKMSVESSAKRFVDNIRFNAGQDTGNFVHILIFLPRVQKQCKSFAFPHDSVIGIERLHELAGKNREAAAAQNDFSPGIFSDLAD